MKAGAQETGKWGGGGRLAAGNRIAESRGAAVRRQGRMADQGKTRRMEGVAGAWPAGQLVVGGALGSQVLVKAALETCWTLPSPSNMLPAPAVLLLECIFKDQEIEPVIGMATSFPFPLFGEKP